MFIIERLILQSQSSDKRCEVVAKPDANEVKPPSEQRATEHSDRDELVRSGWPININALLLHQTVRQRAGYTNHR